MSLDSGGDDKCGGPMNSPSSATHRHRLFIRYMGKNRAGKDTWARAGAEADRPGATERPVSFRIQAAHAPVVTADTSFVNPFLHTKLWREE